MADIKLCMIGTGNHARLNLYPAIREAGGQIVGIAARHIENAKNAALAFSPHAAVFSDYVEMLSRVECDGAVIAAQPDDQYKIALQCVRLVKPVFAEKPLGWTGKEAHTLAEAAEKAGTLVMIGFMKRYAPCYSKIAEVIKGGELGRVCSFHITFAADTARFCRTAEEFIKLAAIHIVDLTRALFGEVKDVKSMQNQLGKNLSLSISCEMESGAIGNLYLCSGTAWSREPESITITFENGFARTDGLNHVTVHRVTGKESLGFTALAENDSVFTPTDTPMSGSLRDLYLRGFVGELKHYIDCLQSKHAPFSSALDNIKTMELCEQLLMGTCNTLP